MTLIIGYEVLYLTVVAHGVMTAACQLTDNINVIIPLPGSNRDRTMIKHGKDAVRETSQPTSDTNMYTNMYTGIVTAKSGMSNYSTITRNSIGRLQHKCSILVCNAIGMSVLTK